MSPASPTSEVSPFESSFARFAHADASDASLASLSRCFASELVSTETRSTKNSAGFALTGIACPMDSNHSDASAHGPMYTHSPRAIKHRSSNIATMLPLGWWIEHTTVLCDCVARVFKDSTTRCAWNASRPLVGSSQQTT